MAKRFTASEKWEDSWFRGLPPAQKLLWLYILDKCDAAGVFEFDQELAEFCIGDSVDISSLGDRVSRLNGSKWWIPKFIPFQYGVEITGLDPKSPVHKGVLRIVEKYALTNSLLIGYSKTINSTKDKDKDKSKDKDKEQEKDQEKKNNDSENTPQVALRSPVRHNENSAEMQGYFDAFFRKYPRPEGEDDARRAYFDVVHNPSDAVGILSALNNYLKSDAVRANYVKLPAKWIRDWKTWLHPTPAMMQGGKQKEKEIPRPVARSKQEEEAAFEKLNSELLRREGVDVKAVNKSNGTKSAVDDSKTLTEEEIQRKKEEARKKLMEEK